MIINHFGLSGGKDSTALWGWAINDSGYDPATIRGSFCDTENEYQEVYDQIAKLDEYGQKRGIAPVRVCRPVRGFLALAQWKHRFPAPRTRFCTEHLKMIPTRNLIREFQWLHGAEVLCHSGVRAAESDERAQLDELDFDDYLKCKVRRPLLAWSIEEVWAAHGRYGLPINPLYLKGRKRVGCRLCCMSAKKDVRVTAQRDPWVIDIYRDWETQFPSGFQSFFKAGYIPDSMCSRTAVAKDGRVCPIPTIDDVVRWSTTERGGKQQAMSFMFEEDDDFDAGLTCKSTMGHCE